MAKIVVPEVPVISFDAVLPVEIVDHVINPITDVSILKYRVRFQAQSLEILKTPIYLIIADRSPYNPKLNMFKNRRISTTERALEAINSYDDRRFLSLNRSKTIMVSTPIEYTDIERGYVDFDVNLENFGIMNLFAYFTSNSRQSSQILSLYSFENSKVVERYEMPYDDFIFNTQTVSKNYRRVLVGSKDKRISHFRVTTRSLYGARQSQLDEQNKTLTIRTKNGQGYVDIPESDSVCREYRVSPISFLTKTVLAQCKTTIVNTERIQTGKCIVYPIEVGSQFATIAIASMPSDVVAVTLLRRNLTQRELEYDAIFTTNNLGSAAAGITDSSLIPYNAYDFKFRLEFRNGNKLITESNSVVFPMFLNDVVKLRVQNPTHAVSNEVSTCAFNVEVDYTNMSQASRIITDLKNLGIDNIFPNEIKNLSTQIDPLISVLVTKTSLLTQVEERVGLYKPGSITLSTRDLTDVIYQFEVCVRSPSDVIEEVGSSADFTVKDASFAPGSTSIIDKVLSINNVTNPNNFTQKFFSKNALNRGQLAYGPALATSSTGIEAGRTGIKAAIFVANERLAPELLITSVTQKSDGLFLKWTARNIVDVNKFEIQAQDGSTQTCDVDINVQNYSATIKTTSRQAVLRAYTNYDSIITTEFTV